MPEIECLKDCLGRIICSALLAGTILSFHSRPQTGAQIEEASDELPDICSIITEKDMEEIKPFTHPLSKMFQDANNFETYKGCHYEFFTPQDKPGLSIRLIKWGSKEEAVVDFQSFQKSEFDKMGFSPESISGVADSAYFSYDGEDIALCNECGLVAQRGEYGIYISLKGQYETVTRAGKKEAALKILQRMYDRIPGLAPSRIRNRQPT